MAPYSKEGGSMKKSIFLSWFLFVALVFGFSQTIFDAASIGDVKAIKTFVEVLGVDPLAANDQDITPMCIAIMSAGDISDNSTAIITYLYDHGGFSPDALLYAFHFANKDTRPIYYKNAIALLKKIEDISSIAMSFTTTDSIEMNTLTPIDFLTLKRKTDTRTINNSRMIAYIATQYPSLSLSTTFTNVRHGQIIPAEQVMNSELVMAFLSAKGDMEGVKRLLKVSTDSKFAVITTVFAGNVKMLDFYNSLGMVKKEQLQAAVSVEPNLAPEMIKYIEKSFPGLIKK